MKHVRIGSQYRPHRFEKRTPTEYRALRPEMGVDAARLQRALLPAAPGEARARRRRVAAWTVYVAITALAFWWAIK